MAKAKDLKTKNNVKTKEAYAKYSAASGSGDTSIGEESSDLKKSGSSINKLEIIVAVLLGATALLTAWATWIGSLHGGNQSTNYTMSNNLAADGNAEYNAGIQLYLSDIMTWNTLMEYTFELALAETENNQDKVELINQKLETYADQNASEILSEGLAWMEETGEDSPFKMPDIEEKYFASANEKIEQSQELLREGQNDNAKGDAYNLVSVIYSLVLFLLGIVGIFKSIPNRAIVLIIAAVCLVITTIYMFTIPLPTGFDIRNFIGLM